VQVELQGKVMILVLILLHQQVVVEVLTLFLLDLIKMEDQEVVLIVQLEDLVDQEIHLL
tara:strand:+ start:159 stop:335 length:177 start_codon:yes stop_codon:yes gene_type:complete